MALEGAATRSHFARTWLSCKPPGGARHPLLGPQWVWVSHLRTKKGTESQPTAMLAAQGGEQLLPVKPSQPHRCTLCPSDLESQRENGYRTGCSLSQVRGDLRPSPHGLGSLPSGPGSACSSPLAEAAAQGSSCDRSKRALHIR